MVYSSSRLPRLKPQTPWPEPRLPIAACPISPLASTFMGQAAAQGTLEWRQREYTSADVEGAALVFGATNDRALNARVAADARQRGIPVLAVDDVPNCDFIA